ncbi:MAG: hypothetical protein IPO92_12340 [Saprospiraceae bacterium]|nr:hypothetical protein [Saprospiraceae bacterium]
MINFFEINLCAIKPIGAFKKNIPSTKPGIEIAYLRQIKAEKPLFWGLSFYYTQLGNSSATLEEFLDFALVDFNYSTTSNLMGLNGKFRFYPDISLGRLEPYLEAQLGYKWLYTGTTKTLASDTESSDFMFEESNFSLTYGISAGLNYRVKENVYINFKANYLPGLSTAYYAKDKNNQIEFSSIDQFNLKNSTTDILRWDLGVTFWPSFNSND